MEKKIHKMQQRKREGGGREGERERAETGKVIEYGQQGPFEERETRGMRISLCALCSKPLRVTLH